MHVLSLWKYSEYYKALSKLAIYRGYEHICRSSNAVARELISYNMCMSFVKRPQNPQPSICLFPSVPMDTLKAAKSSESMSAVALTLCSLLCVLFSTVITSTQGPKPSDDTVTARQ